MKKRLGKQGFVSLFALLLVAGIIAYLWISSMDSRPQPVEVSDSGIKVQRTDSSNYQTTLDHTIGQIEQFEKRQLDRPGQLLNQMKGVGLQ